jgi:hypothetical protein
VFRLASPSVSSACRCRSSDANAEIKASHQVVSVGTGDGGNGRDLAVMIGLFLGIRDIGKFHDIQATTIQAARYAAWERTAHGPGWPPPWPAKVSKSAVTKCSQTLAAALDIASRDSVFNYNLRALSWEVDGLCSLVDCDTNTSTVNR